MLYSLNCKYLQDTLFRWEKKQGPKCCTLSMGRGEGEADEICIAICLPMDKETLKEYIQNSNSPALLGEGNCTNNLGRQSGRVW